MNRACCPCWPDPRARDSQAGVTLTEVLVAIFLMGVGLLARGSIDPAKAAELRRQHELLKDQAHDLEVRLEALRFVFPPQQIGPPVALLAQVHAIRAPLKAIIQLLFLVERQAIVESPL